MKPVNIWVITDTHFGHDKMLQYCNRPLAFEQKTLNNISKVVQQKDILIHLGDFCIGQDEYWHNEFMKYCPGKRWLVRGNHDRKSMSWYFRHGWNFVGDVVCLDVFGKHIVLSHKPIDDTLSTSTDWINVHGHLHNTLHHPECHAINHHKLLIIEHHYTPILLKNFVGA